MHCPDPASSTVVVRAFPGVKWPGHGIDPPPQSSVKVKETIELFLDSTSVPLWPLLVSPRDSARKWDSARCKDRGLAQ